MQKNYKIIIFFSMIFVLISNIYSSEGQDGKIKIAITDFEKRGDATEVEVEELSEVIRSKISETGVFEIIERVQTKKLVDETKFQSSGLTQEEIISFGEMSAVKMLLLGTVGRLYDKVIITVRLVNAETGKITFSNTLYSSKEEIFPNITKLASQIADNGILSNTEIKMLDIDNDIDDERYHNALQKIKRYMDSEENTDDMGNAQQKKKEIEDSLAKQDYTQAKKYLRKKYYREALDLINEAIILKGSEQYYNFRDKIIEEQEANSRRDAIRLERIKQQREKDQLEAEAGYLSFQELISLYYTDIPVSGFHLGAVAGHLISEKNEISDLYNWWGGEFIYLGGLSELNYFVDKIWYAGLLFNIKEQRDGYNSFGIQPWISPGIGFNLQLLNLLLNMGVDLGGILNFNNLVEGGMELGVSAGAMAMAEFKFFKSLGLYVTMKVDYEWIIEPVLYHGPAIRISAGLAF